jgi:SAM-dependent methyltransferase
MTFDHAWEAEHARRQWGTLANEHLVRFITRNYAEGSLCHFLDLGAGAGAQSMFLSNHGRVVAVDGSQTALDRIRHATPCIVTQCIDLVELQFPQYQFDCIVDVASLQCLPIDEAWVIIKRARRWLKPGGFFFSFTDAGSDPALHTIGAVYPRTELELTHMFSGYDVRRGSETVERPDGTRTAHWIIEAKVKP